MATRLGADGTFAMAYVVAHEVAHHVQTLLGISGKVNRLRQQASEAQSNALSVKLELQADCLAGIRANRAQGDVVPQKFTHGTSAERVAWFRKGLQTGDLGSSDTFAGGMLVR